jgi:hypothetical protein
MKNVPATARVVTELEEEGRQQAPNDTFGGILKVEVVVCDQCGQGVSHVLDVLDNSGAYQQYGFPITETDEKPRTKELFSQRRL